MSEILKDEKFKEIIDSRTYPVRWLIKALKVDKNKTCHLCICGYSHRIWYMAPDGDNLIKPMVISSIDICDGECLDSKWCLDLECKYNQTTARSYAKSYHLSDKETDEIITDWDQFIKNIKAMNEVLTEYETDFLNFQTSDMMEGSGPLVEWVKAKPKK